ncbi:hypothetical protein FO488_12815 [Geobacter sp. FeAm09]|uniref:hypothetical protein n=1 Tax=Geobacter sp. FeAm09 TaxID=2597769 RepID=UPI0011ED056C|nr:hypothetical protein [Geobacter sp. FeAm09]QEM68950.1 hypothetical protein FO488_12815 [Geobacter sp. FeAm09]
MECKEEIRRYFDELIALGELVLATKQSPDTPAIGDFVLEPRITYVWVTHVQNLLVKVFGAESAYYENFSYLIGRELTFMPMLRAQELLKSARDSFLPESSVQGYQT